MTGSGLIRLHVGHGRFSLTSSSGPEYAKLLHLAHAFLEDLPPEPLYRSKESHALDRPSMSSHIATALA